MEIIKYIRDALNMSIMIDLYFDLVFCLEILFVYIYKSTLSVIDREGAIGNGDFKGSMADASELSLAIEFYERAGKDRG